MRQVKYNLYVKDSDGNLKRETTYPNTGILHGFEKFEAHGSDCLYAIVENEAGRIILLQSENILLIKP